MERLARRFLKIAMMCLFLLMNNQLRADVEYTISGYVKDIKTGEALIGASIIDTVHKSGCKTNSYGFYSFTLRTGEHVIKYRYIGYDSKEQKINLTANITLNVELNQLSVQTKEVVVTGERGDDNIKNTEMGVSRIVPSEVKTIPVFFGEQDILKTIQLLPGISGVSEGSSGFVVRGGSPDQNLILLDEANVYNPSHLLGFFSVFNSDAINDVKIYKGSAPAQYGGRLSSLLDIKMNEGNNKKFDVNGGIGLISSRLTIQGPIIEDESSFIISGRRTYADLFLLLTSDTNLKKSSVYFYDLNLKANYKFGEHDRLFVSGYLGRDVATVSDQFGFNFGNTTLTTRWNHLFSDNLFLNTSFIYSKYGYVVNLENGAALIDVTSAIQDFNIKEDFEYFINTNNTLNFGLNAVYHTFVPGQLNSKDSISNFSNSVSNKYAMEFAFFISHELDLLKNFKVNYGLRYSGFAELGPGNVITYNSAGDVTDIRNYNNNQLIKYYGGFEPRISLNYLLQDNNSIKASYTRNMQYLHLLSNTTSTTPLDIWQPSTNNVLPGIADQISLGYYQNFDNNLFEASIEGYYKILQNQIEYKNGADLLLNPYVESELVYGAGKAYGIELFIKKNYGKFTGWLSYTLSRSERTFDGIDNGNPFPFKYDRTHDISLVGSYQLDKHWNFSATWVYYTGNAVTFPSGKYDIGGNVVNLFTTRNSYRMPAYHRLDIGFTYYFEDKGKYQSNLNVSLYNAYGRKNAYSINFVQNKLDPTKSDAVMTYFFTFCPSVTYNFNF